MNRSFMLNVIAVLGGIIGSLIIAVGEVSIIRWGYVFFLFSAAAAATLQYRVPEQRGLLILSGFYMAVNVAGLLRWSGFNLHLPMFN